MKEIPRWEEISNRIGIKDSYVEDLARRLREIVVKSTSASKGIEEVIDGGNFFYKKNGFTFCEVIACDDYVKLRFPRGSDFIDPENLLCDASENRFKDSNSMRHILIESLDDIKDAYFDFLIYQSVKIDFPSIEDLFLRSTTSPKCYLSILCCNTLFNLLDSGFLSYQRLMDSCPSGFQQPRFYRDILLPLIKNKLIIKVTGYKENKHFFGVNPYIKSELEVLLNLATEKWKKELDSREESISSNLTNKIKILSNNIKKTVKGYPSLLLVEYKTIPNSYEIIYQDIMTLLESIKNIIEDFPNYITIEFLFMPFIDEFTKPLPNADIKYKKFECVFKEGLMLRFSFSVHGKLEEVDIEVLQTNLDTLVNNIQNALKKRVIINNPLKRSKSVLNIEILCLGDL